MDPGELLSFKNPEISDLDEDKQVDYEQNPKTLQLDYFIYHLFKCLRLVFYVVKLVAGPAEGT